MKRSRSWLTVLVVASALVAALPAGARAEVIDQGSFKIYRFDKVFGAETLVIETSGDSLVYRARQYLMIPTAQGVDTLEKGADFLTNRTDLALRQYQSRRKFRGVTMIRALDIADTHYVAYRETEGRGAGESRVLPPGRLYVMDSQLATSFDYICRNLHGSSIENRSINLLALGPSDTLLEARVIELGSETIRWGARPVVASKLHIVADSQTTFTAWVSPQGQLLRLLEPVGGLRVERDPPPVKRRRPPPKKTGG